MSDEEPEENKRANHPFPLSQILVTVGRNCEYRISLGKSPGALANSSQGNRILSRAKSNGKTRGVKCSPGKSRLGVRSANAIPSTD